MSDFAEVIALLEKATRPSLELDAKIEFAIGKYDRLKLGDDAHLELSWIGRDEDRAVGIDVVGPNGGRVCYTEYPAKLTASIDAALTLAPKGCSIHAHIFTHYDGAISEVEVGAGKKGQSTTPAIAVCIAALKSRQWVAERNAALASSGDA